MKYDARASMKAALRAAERHVAFERINKNITK
jgi:hypothetical protein